MLTRDKSAKNFGAKPNQQISSIRRSNRNSSKAKPNNMVDIDQDEECNVDIDQVKQIKMPRGEINKQMEEKENKRNQLQQSPPKNSHQKLKPSKPSNSKLKPPKPSKPSQKSTPNKSLKPIQDENYYEIQRVIRRRLTINGQQQLLVSWRGYSNHANRWIPRNKVVGLHLLDVGDYMDSLVLELPKIKKQGKKDNKGKIKCGSGYRKNKRIRKMRKRIEPGQLIILQSDSQDKAQQINKNNENKQQYKTDKIQPNNKQIKQKQPDNQQQKHEQNNNQQAHSHSHSHPQHASQQNHPYPPYPPYPPSSPYLQQQHPQNQSIQQKSIENKPEQINKVAVGLKDGVQIESRVYQKKNYSQQQLAILHRFYRNQCVCAQCMSGKL